MSGALNSLKVLDFTTLLPGPYATMCLADMGADVLRVVSGSRPDLVDFFPPMVPGTKLSAASTQLGRSKRCMALNLKDPRAIQIIHRLIADYDIVIEQFRPGVMAKLGLDYESLKKVNPAVIYCAITGYGQTGPKAQIAGHDLNYMAETGLLALAAGPDGAPVVPPALVADIAGGTYPAFMNILLALMRRQQTGPGGFVDIAMSRNIEVFNCWSTIDGALAARWPVPGGGRHTGGSPRYNLYAARDGRLLAVGALEDRFWQQFLDGIGLTLPPELERHDPATAIERVAAHLRGHDAAFWLERLNGRDACCNLVTDPPELLERRKADVRSDPERPPVLPDIPLPLSPPLISDP